MSSTTITGKSSIKRDVGIKVSFLFCLFVYISQDLTFFLVFIDFYFIF